MMFVEWVVFLFFVFILVREMYVIYKLKKKNFWSGVFFLSDNIVVYCIVVMFVDGFFEDVIVDDFGIGWGVCLNSCCCVCGEVIDGVFRDDRVCRIVDINDNWIFGCFVDWNGVIKNFMYIGVDIDGN